MLLSYAPISMSIHLIDQCLLTGGMRPTYGWQALTFESPKPLL